MASSTSFEVRWSQPRRARSLFTAKRSARQTESNLWQGNFFSPVKMQNLKPFIFGGDNQFRLKIGGASFIMRVSVVDHSVKKF